MIPIDKNIPIPPELKVSNNSKYPWKLMEVGDSFKINVKQSSAWAMTNAVSKKLKPKRFKACKINDEVRVWRIK